MPGSAISGESGLAHDQHEGRNVVTETDRRRTVVMIPAVALATVAIVVIGCILRAARDGRYGVMTILAVGIAFDLSPRRPLSGTVSSSSVLLPEAVTGLRSAWSLGRDAPSSDPCARRCCGRDGCRGSPSARAIPKGRRLYHSTFWPISFSMASGKLSSRAS